MSPNPTAIIADGQTRRMTGSGAGVEFKSALSGGAAETDADGDRTVTLSLLARLREHASWRSNVVIRVTESTIYGAHTFRTRTQLWVQKRS